MYRLGITFIIAMAVMSLNAQDSLRRSQIDSLTYQQYLNKDYKNLIETSKEAHEQNIDFYYLNYRTAIAYYELKNYAKAAEFYKKTLSETPTDPALQESLYYSYLLSGQKENANITVKSLVPHAQAAIGYKPSAVDFVSLSGGYMANDNKPDIETNLAGTDSLNQFQNMAYAAFGIGFKLSDRAKLKLGYQLYNTEFQRSRTGNILKEDNLSQHQLISALEFFTENNITWGFAGGYYNIEKIDKGTTYSTTASAIYTGGTRAGGYGPGGGGGRPGGGFYYPSIYYTTSTGNTSSTFSILAFLNKRFVYTLPEIAVAYSNFGGGHQYQAKGSLTFYPMGNLDFYGTTGVAFVHNQNAWTDTQFIFSQSLGVKLAKQLWLDGTVSIGNHQNYITERSFLVYDTYDPVKAIAGLSLSYFFKKTMISAGYQWQQREGYAYSSTSSTTYKYNNQLFNFALSWNF